MIDMKILHNIEINGRLCIFILFCAAIGDIDITE